MSDWWSRKIGGGAPVAPARPVGPPVPVSIPGRMPAVAPMPTYPQQQGMPPAEVPVTEDGQVHALDAVQSWRGGKGVQTERERCPNCGSGNYFSRSNAGSVVNVTTGQRATPAPICEDCGFPLVQSGSPTGELAAVTPTGGGVARQAVDSNALPMFTVVGRVSG